MTVDWKDICIRIRRIMSRHAHVLTSDTIDAVEHYLTHDEYEMAFEGLCIDLMHTPELEVDWSACIDLATELGLDKESVFDGDFWSKLTRRQSSGPVPQER